MSVKNPRRFKPTTITVHGNFSTTLSYMRNCQELTAEELVPAEQHVTLELFIADVSDIY